jgi:hypothetical protein
MIYAIRYILDPNSIPKVALPFLGVAASPLLYFTKSSIEGAQTQIYLAASKSITKSDSGKYYDNSREADISAEAKDISEAKALWKESERLTGVKFPNFS